MLVEDIMIRSVVTLTAEQPLRDAVDLLRSKHIRQLPVVEGSKLIGIITDRDVKRALPSILSGVERADYDRILDTAIVSQFMTREPMTVTPDTGLKAAVTIFIDRKVGALPVVANGKLVGIITQIDVLRLFHDMLAD
jgi:acetoin utilization protein AcuB